MLITSILDVELGVTRLSHASTFYESAWGLTSVSQTPEASVLRAAGIEHHVLVLRPAPLPSLLSIGFSVDDPSGLEVLYASLVAKGNPVRQVLGPVPLALGGGLGFQVEGPSGLLIRISTLTSRYRSALDGPSHPQKLSHVVINCPDRERMVSWLVDSLGFRISDTTRTQTFLRCAQDHHSLAISSGESLSVNHIAYELHDIDAIMHATGRMMDHGYHSEWGLGRHGPGNNVFNYFIDPEGFAIEFTSGLEQILDEQYQARTPDYWSAFPRRPCRWGVARKPSEKLIRAFSGHYTSDSR